MAQVRKRRDGTVTVASTIYLAEAIDSKASEVAKERTQRENKKISKSKVIVEVVEKNL